MDRNKHPLDPHHIEYHWVRPKWFWAYGTFGANHAPILCRDQYGLQTNQHHLGVPLGQPKKFPCMWYIRCKPYTYLTPRLTLSKQTQTSFHLTHVTKEYHRVCPKLFLSLWYVLRKSCTFLVLRLTLSPKEPNELPLDPHHWGDRSGAPNMISELVARSAQTMHLSFIEINTITKLTETSFHLTDINLDYHQEPPKRFPSLCYIWHKLCTYLVLRWSLSPNRPKIASTWATSPRSSIGCVQNDFFSILHVSHKLCTYLALTLTLSPNGPKWASTWSTSCRSTW
jgi:hypothetical protein